jgi:dTDP-4-dehydrorhamnose reductase
VATIKELKWLILGSEGQLGKAMAAELVKHGADFVALNHDQLSITEESLIENWFNNVRPTIVVNAAAWTNVDGAELAEKSANLVNGFGPKLLAEASSKIGAQFIHISTDYVFSGDSHIPWGEDMATSPISAYGRSKALGEKLVLDNYPNSSFIVRTAGLYSPWGKNFVKRMLDVALKDSDSIKVVSDQTTQPTSATELAEQIYKLILSKSRPGIYHGTNSGETTWYLLAQEVFKFANCDSQRLIPISLSDYPQLARRPRYGTLSHKNWSKVGLTPMRHWKVALKDALPAILRSID